MYRGKECYDLKHYNDIGPPGFEPGTDPMVVPFLVGYEIRFVKW
jgi:hypothetical protein